MVASVLLTLPSARLIALALVAAASLLHFTASLPDRRWVMPMLVACGTLVLVAPLVSVVASRASRVSWLWPRLFARRGASPGANPGAHPGASTGGGPAREPRRGAGGTPGLLSFVRLVVALLLAGPLLLWQVHDALDSRLPAALEGLDLEVVGRVDGMPQRFDFGDRVRFTLGGCRTVGDPKGGGSSTSGRDRPEDAGGPPENAGTENAGTDCGRLQRLQLDWGPLAEKLRKAHDARRAPKTASAERGEEAASAGLTRWSAPGGGAGIGEGGESVEGDDTREGSDEVEGNDGESVSASESSEGEHPRDEVWPRPGEYWRLTVRLKRPHAPVNPGGFDLELRYLQQGVGALGRVYARERLPHAPAEMAWQPGAAVLVAFEGWRTTLRDRLEAVYAHRVASPGSGRPARWDLLGVVAGLALGDQGAIGAGLWGLFSRTGVSHLMAISGMHVTMLALVAAWLAGLGLRTIARRGGSLSRLLGRVPRQVLVLSIAVLAAFGYALLSGWGIPSQRTCWMLTVAAITSLSGRGRGAMDVTLLAAAVVVAFNPWAVATAGFWLSFGAVVAILWCAHGQDSHDLRRVAIPGIGSMRLPSALREAITSQWAATVGLAPLVVALFSTFSLIGPAANAVAIPLVSFLVTPLAVAAALSAPLAEPLAAILLHVDLWMIDRLIAMLHLLDRLPAASVAIPAPGPLTLVCAVIGAAVTIAPSGFPMRAAGWLCLLPMLLAASRLPAPDELRITVLDIGQGSSVLVEAGHARLLFDAGRGSGVDRSAAARFLVPYLRSRGIETIDMLVVSHLDVEHAGGAAAVLHSLRPARLLTGFDVRLMDVEAKALARVDKQACVAGMRLQSGLATIEILHPPAIADRRHRARDNAAGCVLRVSSPAGSVLLTADLPASEDLALVRSGGERLRSDVLVVPQQGGRNATSALLLAAVQPSHALLQVGYRNRHRHPHPAVLERLAQSGGRVLRTDLDGAIEVRLRASTPPQVRRWRRDSPPYWRVGEDATAPSTPRRSTRRRRGPDRRPASRGTPPSRRSAPA